MALINLIRIDEHSGVLLADEEFWRRGYRRTNSLDNLQRLLPESFSQSTGVEVVIGIEGDPSITYEAVLWAQRSIRESISDSSGKTLNNPAVTVKQIADIAVDAIGRLIRKRIDDQLGFAFGFTASDLTRGYYESGGEKIDIKQEKIRNEALGWIKYREEDGRTKQLFEINALIAGVDQENGFHFYEWSGTLGNLFLGSSPFESIGKGSDAANLAFIDIFRKQDLASRRKGLKPEEAIFILIEALEAASRFNHEVGGYPQIMLISGSPDPDAKRFVEYSGHGAKLAQEIVTACVHGFLSKAKTIALVKRLVIMNEDFFNVEKDFLAASKEPEKMEHFLRGYRNRLVIPEGEIVS